MLELKDPFVVGFKKELLRWNSQISLVSRRGTGGVLDNLLFQSIAGYDVFCGYVNSVVDNFLDNPTGEPGQNAVDNPVGNYKKVPFDGIYYFDLGSGGGFPGVLWTHLIQQQKIPSRSFLVEPREKRSWFLNRVSGKFFNSNESSGHSVAVIPERWGEGLDLGLGKTKNPVFFISLKALHLKDSSVLDGLKETFPQNKLSGQLFIARYYPRNQQNNDQLKKDLGFPHEGEALSLSFNNIFHGCRVLSFSPGGFLPSSLVVSHYSF